MALIYVAEDDRSSRELIRTALSTFRHEVELFANGRELLQACKTQVPDCILLDLTMPVMDGMSALRELRRHETTENCPIIIVSARNAEMDIVLGLEAGADDYITKPFRVLELGARIKAALRQAHRYAKAAPKPLLVAGDLVLNEEARVVLRGDELIDLTRKEYRLLLTLWKASPAVVPRQVLLETVWGYSDEGESRTLDMHIRSLRVKLGDPTLIHTLHGVGYRFFREGSAD